MRSATSFLYLALGWAMQSSRAGILNPSLEPEEFLSVFQLLRLLWHTWGPFVGHQCEVGHQSKIVAQTTGSFSFPCPIDNTHCYKSWNVKMCSIQSFGNAEGRLQHHKAATRHFHHPEQSPIMQKATTYRWSWTWLFLPWEGSGFPPCSPTQNAEHNAVFSLVFQKPSE